MAQLQGLSERHDLRSGPVPWNPESWHGRPSDPFPEHDVDIAILGADILESELAGRLDPDRDAFDPHRFDGADGARP